MQGSHFLGISHRAWLSIAGAAVTIVFAITFLSMINAILMPFVVAFFIAYLLDPVTDKIELSLRRKKIGPDKARALAVSIIFLLFTLFSAMIALILVPLLIEQTFTFIQQLPQTLEWLHKHLSVFLEARLNIDLPALDFDPLKQMIAENWKQATRTMAVFFTKFSQSTMSLIGTLANLALIPVVSFYLLRDWDHMLARVKAYIPSSFQTQTIVLAGECDQALSAFIRGQLLVMLALGLVYSLGLSFVGLELALLIGMISGLASIVPYLGFIVGIISALVAGFFQFDSSLSLALIVGVYLVGQVLESVVFTPVFVGDKIGMHPVLVIFAIMAGGQLAGFVGVLIALPVSAVLMVLMRHLLAWYRNSYLFDEQESTDD